jgi:hypothetical protein
VCVQAIYGRTGGLYSRFELMRSLGLHKEHTRSMVEEMRQQETAVVDMYDMLAEQTAVVSWKGPHSHVCQ